ncbi:hypothetical protein EIP86_011235 [Pleurotus ostreatoroseus]|nr:hypothetical protein EIP86_011235 [Pleurotus ostreatoroseus]
MSSVVYAPAPSHSSSTPGAYGLLDGEDKKRGPRKWRLKSAFQPLSKVLPAAIMTGLRNIATRSKSKAPPLRPENEPVGRPKNRRRTITFEDEDEDEDHATDDEDSLTSLSKDQLISRLMRAKTTRGSSASLSLEEQAELDDDPFADFEEDESAVRPHKHNLEPIEEDPEGEEDPRAGRPAKRVRGDPKFNTSEASTVASNLSRARRKPAPTSTATPAVASTPSSQAPAQSQTAGNRTPERNRAITTEANQPELPYTPFKVVRTGKKAREADASPSTKSLVKHSCLKFRVGMAVGDAWPSEAEVLNETTASFANACDEVGADRRLQRFRKEHTYSEYIINVVEQRRSQLRGEVKSKAQAEVVTMYKLEGTRVQIAERVKLLLTKKTFTFRDTETRYGMYGNAIFEHIIARQWFAHADSEGCGRYSKQFNPIPLPLLALVATAVHCALMDWESGTFEPRRNKFEHHVYEPIYRDHLGSLNKWKQANPAACAARQQGLWQHVWKVSGREPPSATKGDDFDEEEYNRAE